MCRKISDMTLIVAGPPMEVRETCQRDEDCRLSLLLPLTLLSSSGIIMILPPNQLRAQAGWDLYDLAVRPRHRERQVRLPYHPSTSYFTSLFKKKCHFLTYLAEEQFELVCYSIYMRAAVLHNIISWEWRLINHSSWDEKKRKFMLQNIVIKTCCVMYIFGLSLNTCYTTPIFNHLLL